MSRLDIMDRFWVHYLQETQVIETPEEKTKRWIREKVIALFRSTLQEFIRCVKKEHGYKRDIASPILSPFGSYGIGGYVKNADIDIVMIAPHSIKRADFFKFFPANLKQLATIRDVECVKRTAVPIIKCVVDNISIDISFVRLKSNQVDPKINFLDDSLLNDLDEVCLASMDGPRVNQYILNSIKEQHLPIFCLCLQSIKHWAMRRQIYNKPSGYLNGSSWTILLLKTYLVKRNQVAELTVTYLLDQFFQLWMDWPWPVPVCVTDSIPGKDGTTVEYDSLVEFEQACMPIVSPCYPVVNAAPNVTLSTRKVLQREFERAAFILERTDLEPREVLRKLFNPVDYFARFSHFLSITTSSSRQRSHEIWTRKMPYNIPQLITMIESRKEFKLIQAIYNPKQETKTYATEREKTALRHGEWIDGSVSYTEPLNPGTLYLTHYFIGMKLDTDKEIDLSEETRSFMAYLDSKRNANDDDVSFAINHMRRKQIAKMMNYPI
ncbi:Poly(A) polymerase gamma [Choanephora cucurbitarum]|uniref:polynucleotide adenylyltransferase n=1 Tax=Choanephora cucurbitarum TaxID=101091 RepID=A0A1C7N556_9FUNG|nr:Poly(A) polymerase gamma [Choanephora cucurbitarum]